MWESWSANLEKDSCSFVNPLGGTTVRDPETYEMVYTPAAPIIIEGVKLDLTTSELSARQQLQDDSKQKVVLKDTTEARTIDGTHGVTVDGIEYKIGGKPKHPRLPNSLITIYISKK